MQSPANLGTHKGEETGTKHVLMFLMTQFKRRRVKRKKLISTSSDGTR